MWTGTTKELEKFYRCIKKIHKTIKLSNKNAMNKKVILDTKSTLIENSTFSTDIFEADAHQHFHKKPVHPQPSTPYHTIPYIQFLRIRKMS